jgi:hypothetical protein
MVAGRGHAHKAETLCGLVYGQLGRGQLGRGQLGRGQLGRGH